MKQDDFESVYKQKLLATFKYLVGFLNENRFRWWVAYGTLIGAIRHKGIIPWDDDIDIYMPKSDYDRLLSLHEKLSKGSQCHYEIQHITINPDYGARFAKVMDMNTTIQTKKFIPYVKGVFIDIFPLYSSNENIASIIKYKQKVNNAWGRYFDYCRHYSLVDIVQNGFSPKYWMKVLKTNLRVSSVAKQRALDSALQCDVDIRQNSFEECRYCFSMFGLNTESDIYEASWFGDYKEVIFEDFVVRVPIGYHDLLTQIYGDYMTPPPEDKRVSRHVPYYVNLNERISLQEIAKRVKSGETSVY